MERVGVFDSGDCFDDPNVVYDGPLSGTEGRTMSNDNLISQEIAPADKTAAKQKTEDIWALLPFLVNIPAEDKKGFPVIAKGRAGMDEDFITQMTQRPELVPGFVNMTEVNKDLKLRRDLEDILPRLEQLVEAIKDTTALANHDNYLAYLAFYNNVKAAQQRGVPGADALLATLAKYFPGGRRKATPAPTPPTP